MQLSKMKVRVSSFTNLATRRSIHVLTSVEEVREIRHQCFIKNSSVGFVPTMGALHAGHISLVAKAKAETDVVISSVFVNPSQFSAGEDLEKYPRTLDSDIAKLKEGGVEYVFAPSTDVMYPTNSTQLCHVEPKRFSEIMEGMARPEFFRGVATVVAKLFNIVQPTKSFFGQKDISQCILIKRMVQDLNMDVFVRVVETMREENGLAMSSRNVYLSPDERKQAGILFRALMAGKAVADAAHGTGTTREAVLNAITQTLLSDSAVTSIEYVSIASPVDMTELDHVDPAQGAVLSSAIRLGTGQVRLIDNVLVGEAIQTVFN